MDFDENPKIVAVHSKFLFVLFISAELILFLNSYNLSDSDLI